jgi:hypothetical protein
LLAYAAVAMKLRAIAAPVDFKYRVSMLEVPFVFQLNDCAASVQPLMAHASAGNKTDA